MSEEDSTTAETGAESTTTTDASAETADTDWKAEAEKAKADVAKWKALSRKNETALQAERDKAAKASMTADEKVTAEAEQRGRKAAAVGYGKRLAAAEFKAAAAQAGVDLGDAADLIDTAKFVDDETGDVDGAAVKAAVKRLAKLAPKPASGGPSGADFAGGGGDTTNRVSADQLNKMTPTEVDKAYREGRLNHLL